MMVIPLHLDQIVSSLKTGVYKYYQGSSTYQLDGITGSLCRYARRPLESQRCIWKFQSIPNPDWKVLYGLLLIEACGGLQRLTGEAQIRAAALFHPFEDTVSCYRSKPYYGQRLSISAKMAEVNMELGPGCGQFDGSIKTFTSHPASTSDASQTSISDIDASATRAQLCHP